MKEGRFISTKDEFGRDIQCELLMFYSCIENGKDYIFYTDNEYDEDGDLNIYASRYLGEKDGQIQMEDIIDDKEWDLLDKAFEEAKRGLEG